MIFNASANTSPSRFYRARELRGVELNQLTDDLLNNKLCIFIDGIDEAVDPSMILNVITSSNAKKIICTSRPIVLGRNIQSFFDYKIQMAPFTINQTAELFTNLGLANQYINVTQARNMEKRSGIETTPRYLLQYISSQTDMSNFTPLLQKLVYFLYQYGEGIDFIPLSQAHESNLIVPSEDVIKNISVINESLIEKVKKIRK